MNELQKILSVIGSSPEAGGVLATLVSVEGSSYRRPGARMLLMPDGRRAGSISGGCLEEDVICHAREVMATGRPVHVTYDTTSENDLVWGVGLGCHGVVHVLVEKLPPQPVWAALVCENIRRRLSTELAVVWRSPDSSQLGTRLVAELPSGAGFQPATDTQAGMSAPRSQDVFYQKIAPPTALFVFGAGDDAQPLVRFAFALGWQVTVVDPRPALATPERFPEANATVIALPDEGIARIAIGGDSLAVVMTHHYRYDLPLLRVLLPRPLAYLGLLGPKKRAEKLLSDLASDGFTVTPEMRARLHAPIGLDLGANNAEEVALAILAEILAVLAGRDGRPLRERVHPIHG